MSAAVAWPALTLSAPCLDIGMAPGACRCSSPNATAAGYAGTSFLPRCTPSARCGSAQPHTTFEPLPRHRAAIVIAYTFNRTRVRWGFAGKPFASYLKDVSLLARLLFTLQRVNTTLPVGVYLGGERFPQYESRLAALGASLRELPIDLAVPRWANPWHRSTFTKLSLLWISGYERIIALDVDAVALRNIDHLAAAPAPAFAYQLTKCTHWELNSGTMVLEPSASARERMEQLLARTRSARHLDGDGGDQSVWRSFFPRVHELPIAYNALKSDNISSWADVYVLHDIWGTRWSKWWAAPNRAGAALSSTLNGLTVAAVQHMGWAPEQQQLQLASGSSSSSSKGGGGGSHRLWGGGGRGGSGGGEPKSSSRPPADAHADGDLICLQEGLLRACGEDPSPPPPKGPKAKPGG